MFKNLLHLPRTFAIMIIKVYQKTVSFDHSHLGKTMFPNGYCRFQPTCSEYGIQAIAKYGVIYGGAKTFWRILRCNPFSQGGYDPVK